MSQQHHQTRPSPGECSRTYHSVLPLTKAHSISNAWVWWYMLVIPLPGRKKHMDHESHTFLAHTVNLYLRRQIKERKKKKALNQPQRILTVLLVNNIPQMSKFNVCSETWGKFLAVKIKHSDTINTTRWTFPFQGRGIGACKGRPRPEPDKSQAGQGQPFSPLLAVLYWGHRLDSGGAVPIVTLYIFLSCCVLSPRVLLYLFFSEVLQWKQPQMGIFSSATELSS